MSYFDHVDDTTTAAPAPIGGLRLPAKKPDAAPERQATVTKEALDRVGKAAGFISRQSKASRRRPGPKRTEPQGKITVTGPQRIIDALQARSDALGGVPYWQVIEELLEASD
jgi:hypothetical protein